MRKVREEKNNFFAWIQNSGYCLKHGEKTKRQRNEG